MTNTLIPLIVGALIGIVPSIINQYFDSKKDNEKWEREKKFQRKQKFQTQLASAGKQLLTLQNSINWFCWIATINPKKITIETVEEYDQEMKFLFPQILSELIEIAIMNEKAYQELDSVYSKLMGIDSKLSQIILQNTIDDKIELQPSQEINSLLNQILTLKVEVIKKVKIALEYNN